jgi:hypothetical protein
MNKIKDGNIIQYNGVSHLIMLTVGDEIHMKNLSNGTSIIVLKNDPGLRNKEELKELIEPEDQVTIENTHGVFTVVHADKYPIIELVRFGISYTVNDSRITITKKAREIEVGDTVFDQYFNKYIVTEQKNNYTYVKDKYGSDVFYTTDLRLLKRAPEKEEKQVIKCEKNDCKHTDFTELNNCDLYLNIWDCKGDYVKDTEIKEEEKAALPVILKCDKDDCIYADSTEENNCGAYTDILYCVGDYKKKETKETNTDVIEEPKELFEVGDTVSFKSAGPILEYTIVNTDEYPVLKLKSKNGFIKYLKKDKVTITKRARSLEIGDIVFDKKTYKEYIIYSICTTMPKIVVADAHGYRTKYCTSEVGLVKRKEETKKDPLEQEKSEEKNMETKDKMTIKKAIFFGLAVFGIVATTLNFLGVDSSEA